MQQETRVIERVRGDINAEMVFDDVEDILQHLHRQQRVLHTLYVGLAIDQMKGNIPRLCLWQQDIQTFVDLRQRL
ncbi:hypothetical protein D3C78_1746570 [compost metagenome]